jgi:hypothetical protein
MSFLLGKGHYYHKTPGFPYAWDGHKYVCEDDFEPGKSCLIYTFGVNWDMSFEEAMAYRGAVINNACTMVFIKCLEF